MVTRWPSESLGGSADSRNTSRYCWDRRQISGRDCRAQLARCTHNGQQVAWPIISTLIQFVSEMYCVVDVRCEVWRRLGLIMHSFVSHLVSSSHLRTYFSHFTQLLIKYGHLKRFLDFYDVFCDFFCCTCALIYHFGLSPKLWQTWRPILFCYHTCSVSRL